MTLRMILEIRSTRTTLGLILGMIALILLFTLLTGLLTRPGGLAGRKDQRQLLSPGSLAGVFSALAGVLLTSEYRFGAIRPEILFNPGRSHVLAAKVAAGALAGIAFGVLAGAVGWAIGYAILDGRGITVVLGSGDILLLTLGRLAGAALWARSALASERSSTTRPAASSRHSRGPRRRRPPVRPRPPGRAVHANPCYGRTDGPASPSLGLAGRRRDHVDRMGMRTGGCRHRPIRSAGHQLTPWVPACAH